MLTVIWSTPRTGSTWYSGYLLTKLNNPNMPLTFLRQYLNQYHMTHYFKNKDPDLLPSFEPYAYYHEYYLNVLNKKIEKKFIKEKRWRTLQQEEDHRISILEKHNLKKFPLLIHQHVNPISLNAYTYLRTKADKNIFLYRKNFIDQLSSYALARHTSIFSKAGHDTEVPVLQNVTVDKQILNEFSKRIQEFWLHDKTGCEVVAYEDIDFSQFPNIQKLNKVRPFDQLSAQTKLDILELNEDFNKFKTSHKMI